MNIVFIGASAFGEKCLRHIVKISRNSDDIRITGVVTAPCQFPISYNKKGMTNVLHADVTSICHEHNIEMTTITDGMRGEGLFNTVEAWKPDLFIVAGWYHMVGKKWRDLAPAYGLHASLLPDYSGGAPLVWAIINGERETGITMFEFDEGVDSGRILGQKRTSIHDDDTIKTVYARIEDLGLDLLSDVLPKIANGSASFTTQDASKRRLVPQRKPEDGLIDWNQDAATIYNFVRAQTKPYPGAFFMNDGKKITVWACECVRDKSPTHIIMPCGDHNAIRILELAIDGVETSITDALPLFQNTHENA